MNLQKLICPNNKKLFKNFTGRALAVKVNSTADVLNAAENVAGAGNSLFCIIVKSTSPLDTVELTEDMRNIPMAVMVPSLGKFRSVVKQIDMLRDFNLRVYLTCDKPENITGLRILSSVGINSCAVFTNGKTSWEELTDLMTYAVLERIPHAPIEPFAYISANFNPFSYLAWGLIHFDDPGHFLYLDAKGRVSLSQAELRKKIFIAQDIQEIESPDKIAEINARKDGWRDYFAKSHSCTFCSGWKVCLGRFSPYLSRNKGCSAFFTEMMEVARRYQSLNAKVEERHIWQP